MSLLEKVLAGVAVAALSVTVFTFGAVLLVVGGIAAAVAFLFLHPRGMFRKGSNLFKGGGPGAGALGFPPWTNQKGFGLTDHFIRGMLRRAVTNLFSGGLGPELVPLMQREVTERVKQDRTVARILGSSLEAYPVSVASRTVSIGMGSKVKGTSKTEAHFRLQGNMSGGTATMVATGEATGEGNLVVESLVVTLDNGKTFDLTHHRPASSNMPGVGGSKSGKGTTSRRANGPVEAEFRDKDDQ